MRKYRYRLSVEEFRLATVEGSVYDNDKQMEFCD
jgi:hypothetical protein